MDSGKKDKAQYIKVHAEDNVAIVVNEGGLPKGAKFSDGLVLKEAVPQGHKVALKDFRPGDPIIRYGMVISMQHGASLKEDGSMKQPWTCLRRPT